MNRALRIGAALAVAAPAVAAACPQCASRDGAGIGTTLLLAGMILLPFGIAAWVAHIIRRGEARTESERTMGERLG